MKRVLVDSSAWYAYLRADDPYHEPVRKALEAWKGRLVTHGYIFDEVLTLVKSRRGHALALRVGDLLRQAEVVELARVTAEDEETAWQFFCRYADKDYSFTDCVSFALMRRLGIEKAVTLDRDFRRAGFETEPEPPAGQVSETAQPYRSGRLRPRELRLRGR